MHRTLKPAKVLNRICAYFIDFLIVTFSVDVIFAFVPSDSTIITLIFIAFQAAYHMLSEGSKLQASPGQWMMNMRLARSAGAGGGYITYGIALDRYLCQAMFMVVLVISKIIFIEIMDVLSLWMASFYIINFMMLLWYGSAIFDPERKAFHDKLLGTVMLDGRAVMNP